MSSTTPPPAWSLDGLKEVITRHWGFSALRPLQEQAMRAVLDGRDSLVVMPTGGGKSLCYQAPAVLRGAPTVVVLTIPLIAPTVSYKREGLRHEQAYSILVHQVEQAGT